MSTPITLNGIPYLIPSTGEVGWGQEVSGYLIAISTTCLTPSSGNFTLTSELNTGPTYGIASPYFRSGAALPATAGVLRLTNSETVQWRNATNTGNLSLYVSGNTLYFNGVAIGGSVSPLTTKGDLFTYSTLDTRLPVGANGTVLVADSSSSTGLSWLSVPGVSGSVTGFSFVNANGFTGVVTNPTTTPSLTLSMSTLPISGGGTGQITKTAAFDALAPTTTIGDISYFNGTNNVRLASSSNKQFCLKSNGAGVLSWGLPTYVNQAVIVTPVDLNSLPNTDLSPAGNGNFQITGTTVDLTNRPPGTSLPASGQTAYIGNTNDAIQVFRSTSGTIEWVRRRVAGTWTNWSESNLPDQTSNSGKYLKTDGTNSSWVTVPTITSGKATLVGGTVTVANADVVAGSVIQLTHQVVGGTQGILSVGTIVANTSFVINSSNALDTGTIGWTMFN